MAAIPQPPLFGDYMSLGNTNPNNTTVANRDSTRNDPLSQYFDANRASISIATTAAESSFAANPAAWSHAHAPSITTTTAPLTMPGHATGTIEVHPQLDDSSSGRSTSPEHHHHRTSTRTSSTASNKSSHSRASTSSKSSAPSTESTSHNNKRSTRQSRASTGGNGGNGSSSSGTNADGTRRDKFLERNRIAASKCRQRKKEWVSGLEEAKNGLESQNSQLQMEYNSLLGEVSRMKNQIMAHATCHDPNIDKWIDNEARRFVQAPEPGGEFQGAAGMGYGAFPEGAAGAPPPFPMDYQFDEGE